MTFDLQQIASILDNPQAESRVITRLMTDSRLVTIPEETLFVALRTPNNDGHRYIPELIARGVKAFIVDHIEPAWVADTTVTFLITDNTLKALFKVGAYCREKYTGTVIAITGSVGKTMLKELLYNHTGASLVTRSPRSWNSRIGVPLSLFSLNGAAPFAVVEAGISCRGEMEKLQELIKPTVGILTPITDEHADGFGSRSEKISEKLNLFTSCHTIFYNADDIEQEKLIKERYSDRHLIPVHAGHPSSTQKLALYCEAVCNEIIKHSPFSSNINLTPGTTRLDIIDGVNNCRIVTNRLNNDTVALRGALEFARRQTITPSRTTLIIDAEGNNGTYLQSIKPLADEFGVARILEVPYSAPTTMVASRDFHDETIVINHSHNNSSDLLVALLEDKQHETVMEVNLDAMVHNFNFFRSRVKASTGVICMLKAHGYGAGAVELARTLQEQGAAYIAVAVVDEGVELRRCGITMPIIVLNPRAGDAAMLQQYRLEPEVFSFDILNQIINDLSREKVSQFPIHIKLETGMRRLGFTEEEIPALCAYLAATEVVKVSTCFSHLACADDPAEDDYTRSQFACFDRCCDALQKALPYSFKRHILNSTGIIRFPEQQHDFVRLGIGLYGVPTMLDGSMSELRNVSRLVSTVISVKNLKAGDSVGYNRRGRLTRDSVIATVPIGYADGIDRHLGYGNASFCINNHLCPTVGSICMDICMIDATDLPGGVKPGDRVEIFGDTVAPQKLADTLGTIPYEVLTSISPRVKRVYYRE